MDKINFKYVYGLLLFLQIVMAATISITSQSKTTYFIVICIELWCVGGHYAIFPNVMRQIYGKQASGLYGLCFIGTGIAALILEVFILSPLGSEFILLFSITGAASVISAILLIFVFDGSRFKPDW